MKIYTTSRDDYLKAILVLTHKNGVVHSTDIAHYLGFSKPSISRAVNNLSEAGYLVRAKDQSLHLTEKGLEIAEKTYERHCFFTKMLVSVGVDLVTAEEDACRLEHAISDISFQKLKESLGSSLPANS